MLTKAQESWAANYVREWKENYMRTHPGITKSELAMAAHIHLKEFAQKMWEKIHT